MKHPDGERYSRVVRSRVELLRATDLSDHDAAWEATLDVLAWLYRGHEAEKKHAGEAAFFADRAATDDGRTLGALMWLRAQVDHHQAEIKAMVWVPWTWGGEPWTWGGEPWEWGVERFRWPPRQNLHWGNQQDKHGRDRDYQRLVQGAELLPPLERAFGWLTSR